MTSAWSLGRPCCLAATCVGRQAANPYRVRAVSSCPPRRAHQGTNSARRPCCPRRPFDLGPKATRRLGRWVARGPWNVLGLGPQRSGTPRLQAARPPCPTWPTTTSLAGDAPWRHDRQAAWSRGAIGALVTRRPRRQAALRALSSRPIEELATKASRRQGSLGPPGSCRLDVLSSVFPVTKAPRYQGGRGARAIGTSMSPGGQGGPVRPDVKAPWSLGPRRPLRSLTARFASSPDVQGALASLPSRKLFQLGRMIAEGPWPSDALDGSMALVTRSRSFLDDPGGLGPGRPRRLDHEPS